MSATRKPYAGPCTPKGKRCPGMALAFDVPPTFRRTAGLEVALQRATTTGALSTAVVYRTHGSKNGVTIRCGFCPFCGAKLVAEGEKKG